jgi:hypothetical protein
VGRDTLTSETQRAPAAYRSKAEAREVIERTFQRIEDDQSLGPHLHASGLRERLQLSDLDLTVEIAAGTGDRCLDWSFTRHSPFEPDLSLTMESAVANSVLQNAESIGVAIARGRIKVSGAPSAALVHLPAMRLIGAEYAGLIATDYPHLVVEH